MFAFVKTVARLLRVREYPKNFFILLPIFFGARFSDAWSVLQAATATVLFCLLASAVYVMNDVVDRDRDRLHPRKKNRPIASGAVSEVHAVWVATGLAAVALFLAFFWRPAVGGWMAVYLLVNILYTFGVKRLGLVDVFVIALGFVIRLFVGAAATGLGLSPWIILMTFLLALFLGFAKRRDDLHLAQDTGVSLRLSTMGYNQAFADGILILISGVTIVCYIMYTMDPAVLVKYHHRPLYPSAGFFIFGVLRYLQIAMVRNEGGSPTDQLWRDRWIQLALLAFVVYFALILYAPDWFPN